MVKGKKKSNTVKNFNNRSNDYEKNKPSYALAKSIVSKQLCNVIYDFPHAWLVINLCRINRQTHTHTDTQTNTKKTIYTSVCN